jgi:hypothetical protein
MSNLVKTIDDIDGGLTAEIRLDGDTREPYADDDAVHIVVLSHKYSDPSNGAVGSDPAAVEQWRKDNEAEWYTVPLWAYVHSGIIYRVGAQNPFKVDVEWDTARAGIIALKRSEWGNGAESDEVLFGYAEGVAQTYSEWLNGECYGYIVKDDDGEVIDSCWGFIGDEGLDRAEAEARAAAANHAETMIATAP